jgi:hypothetical protein
MLRSLYISLCETVNLSTRFRVLRTIEAAYTWKMEQNLLKQNTINCENGNPQFFTPKFPAPTKIDMAQKYALMF